KFATAAAALARTGAQIVERTYREQFVDDPGSQYQGYKDAPPPQVPKDRAWGVSEWAARAGQAAYFNWVVANAVLPVTDTDPTHTGLTKIDRGTVPELEEIVAQYENVAAQLDKVDRGLNPLGLAKNVVPFDINPIKIDDPIFGATHFEQVFGRAKTALLNA